MSRSSPRTLKDPTSDSIDPISAERLRDGAADERLPAEASRLRLILDRIPIPILLSTRDQDPELLYANPFFVATFGYSKDEIPRLSDWAILAYPDEGERQASRDAWSAKSEDAAMHGATATIESRITRKDGAVRDVLVGTSFVDNLMLFSLLDITDFKQTESARHESEERFRLAFDHSNTGKLMVDLDGRILRVNRKTAEIFGYDTDTLERMTVNSIAHPEDLQLSTGVISNAIAGQRDHLVFEKRYRHRDGHIIQGQVTTSLVRDNEGRPLYFVSEIEDITERKRVEAALLVAKEQAEQAHRAKSDFLASMTHELRTPLHAILGFAEILMKMEETPRDPSPGGVAEPIHDPAQRREAMLETILRNGRQLLNLINDVLDLSRLEQGRMPLRERNTDLHILLRDCTRSFVPAAIEKGLALNLELDAALPAVVRVDRQRLTQILDNLLGNAIKFTRQGRVILSAEATPDPLAPERMILRLTVADTGPGITAADQERIFAEFVQAMLVPSQDTPRGTGLGLAICRRLAVLMGGAIGLDSAPGEGSRFTLSIPVTLASSASGPLKPGRGTARARRAPAGATLAADPQPPQVSVLRELKVLAELGQTSRLLDWCRHWSAAKHRPAFAARVQGLALDFENAEIVALVESSLGGADANLRLKRGAAAAHQPNGRAGTVIRPMILAIDDETDTLRLTYEILTEQGLEMASARNGRDGLRIAAALRPDLILLDIRMVELDGFQVCEILKADPATRTIPVIFVSARDQVEDKARGFMIGGVDYVTKPFDLHELILRITNHLRLARPNPTPTDSAETPSDPVATSLSPGRSLEILMRARDRLLADLTVTPDLASLARECHTNRTSLQRLFREHLGLSVFAYLREQRLQRALILLREGRQSVDFAANAVGYSSGPALSRAFKQRFGIAPSRLSC